jgi:outer membrane lipoprotein-sorting protein
MHRWQFKEKSAPLLPKKNRLMKMMKMGMAAMLTLTVFGGVQAQTADEIVNKYINAIGGKDKLEQIKTVYMENTVQVMGNEGPSKTSVVNGKAFRLESEVNGQKMVQVFTDKGGWQINPFMGATTPTPLPDDLYKQSKGQMDVTGPLYNYAAKGNKVELVGKEGNLYKLKVTNQDSVESNWFIDDASYYLVKMTKSAQMMGQTMEVSINFSDFKKTDFGIVFPYTTEVSYGGQFNITSTLKKVEVNKTIDPAIFEMPKS